MEVPAAYAKLVYYTIFILLFDTLALIPFANLRLERKAKKFAFIKLGNILLNLGLNLLFFIKFHMGIEAIFAANLIASAATFLVLLPEIRARLCFTIQGPLFRRMLRFGLPYLPASLASIMIQVIDRPIVLAKTDLETLGLYQTGHKLGIFMMLVVSMFQYAWQPFFLNNAREKNAKEIFAKVMTLFVVAASLLWVVVSLFIDIAAGWEFAPGRSLIEKSFLPGTGRGAGHPAGLPLQRHLRQPLGRAVHPGENQVFPAGHRGRRPGQRGGQPAADPAPGHHGSGAGDPGQLRGHGGRVVHFSRKNSIASTTNTANS